MSDVLKKDRFKLFSWVALVLRKDAKVLLMSRYQTGTYDGYYMCPCGGLDGDEPITSAMIREAKEELGITIKKDALKVVHVLHLNNNDREKETLGFYVEASGWEGEVCNMEPHKHDAINWFSLSGLPNNMPPEEKLVLEMVERGIFFSEYGWGED